MSISEQVPWVLQRLWPEGESLQSPQVFALLDGARDKRIEPLVRLSGRDYYSLYSGWLSPALRLASPYLVHLSREGQLTRSLLNLGWGRSWGMYMVVAADTGPVSLRGHFRKFLRVLSPGNKRLVFRFYDPRVLRFYLPSCKPEELKAFFGPVMRLVIDTPETDLMEFKLEGGELKGRTWPLGGEGKTPFTTHPPVGKEGPPLAIDGRSPLRIRQEQLKAMSFPMWMDFATELTAHLRGEFPERAGEMTNEGLLELALEGIWRANAYGIKTQCNAARYVQLMMHYGKNFDSSPQVPWARPILRDPTLDGAQKMDRLFAEHVRLSAPVGAN